jgi:hypothetical protein
VVIVRCTAQVLGGTEENSEKTSVMIVGVMTDVDWATSQYNLEVLIA